MDRFACALHGAAIDRRELDACQCRGQGGGLLATGFVQWAVNFAALEDKGALDVVFCGAVSNQKNPGSGCRGRLIKRASRRQLR
jgi:hypothetical protein